MTAQQLKRLADNIREDGELTSLPLVYERGEVLEIVSGHHRVQAAIVAEMALIRVLVIVSPLSEERLTAIQLSHNAITGQDDRSILGELYSSLDLDERKYSGLTDDAFSGLDKLGLAGLSIGAVRYEELRINFLPDDQTEFLAFIKRLGKAAEKRESLVAQFKDFDATFDALIRVKEALKVHNAGMALHLMGVLAMERLAQIETENGEATDEA